MAKELTLQFGDFMLQVFMLLLTHFFFKAKLLLANLRKIITYIPHP